MGQRGLGVASHSIHVREMSSPPRHRKREARRNKSRRAPPTASKAVARIRGGGTIAGELGVGRCGQEKGGATSRNERHSPWLLKKKESIFRSSAGLSAAERHRRGTRSPQNRHTV